MANLKVKTSTSGRRYVEISEVIKRRLADIKKRENGNGHGHRTSGETTHERTQVKPIPADKPARSLSTPTST